MKRFKKKAFTLTELLIVVVVLGVLAGVAAPKFKRVLETRKTSEAESMLAAVRTEQEKRCVVGKKYQTDDTKVEALANAKTSKNYTYTLTASGAIAESKGASKSYSIKMMSYDAGNLCCDGEGCSALNKNYPACAALEQRDECSADLSCDDVAKPEASTVTREEGGCQNTYTQKVECDTDYGTWVATEWVLTNSNCGGGTKACSEDPNQPKCCTLLQEWDAKSKKCVMKTCPRTTCLPGKILNPKTCNCRACTDKDALINPAQCCAMTRFSERSGQWWNPLTKSCETKTCPEGQVAYRLTLPLKGKLAGDKAIACCKNGPTSMTSNGQTVQGYSYWNGIRCIMKKCNEGEVVESSCGANGTNCTYHCKDPNGGSGDGDDDDDDDNWLSDDDDDNDCDDCYDICDECPACCGADDDDDDDWPGWGEDDDDDDDTDPDEDGDGTW